ncbi:MAG: UDP-glucose/GDP-mannose dehydrogenase family protein, partial [Nitrososphaeria archaeon]|nr:UDP-glucose/GDP-mannose dehydrogenase family protein [Nitrososphaeria archaeon]
MEDKVSLSFFGLGYVGLTTAACFASKGFKVVCFDVDESKVEAVNGGRIPFFEPKLEELLKYSVERGLLKATKDYREAVLDSSITFVTVGTPAKDDGSIDLTYVRDASRMVGESLRFKDRWHLIVVKSTVVPETTENLVCETVEEFSGKIVGKDFGLCMNPEFLREGNAVEDTFKPDRIIIGEIDKRSGDVLEELYRRFYENSMPPVIRTTPVNAELIKYANNAFLAMKVSFINMVANLCQKLPGSDVEVIAEGIGLDKRIGQLFLKAGIGWGGSCWPKDLKALYNFSIKNGVELPLVEATLKVNETQAYKIIELAKEHAGELKGKRVSVLGLAFKPETDDMRYAVSIKVINRLIEEGAKVIAYDPRAVENARKIFGEKIEYARNVEECLKDSECALILTEWSEFKKLVPEDFIRLMKVPAVSDGRRIYDPQKFSKKLRFNAIGLGERRYYNPAVAVNAIIEEGESILLVKWDIEQFI